jgi:hypothetical protein
MLSPPFLCSRFTTVCDQASKPGSAGKTRFRQDLNAPFGSAMTGVIRHQFQDCWKVLSRMG